MDIIFFKNNKDHISVSDLKKNGYILKSEIDITNFEVKSKWQDIMRNKGLTIDKLAKLAGIDRRILYMSVNRKTKLSIDYAYRISVVLGCNIDDLFTIDGDFYRQCFIGKNPVIFDFDKSMLDVCKEIKSKNYDYVLKKIEKY